MSGTPFRCQIRLGLSDLDRNVYVQRPIATAQATDEPDEHILLRFLAWVLFYDEQLLDGQGFVDLHQPDLLAHDLTGALTLWIECGMPPLKRVQKALGRSKTARFIGLFAHQTEADAFRKELVNSNARQKSQIEIYLIPNDFMIWLETHGGRNMQWTATISEGTLYLDVDGAAAECQPERVPLG
jgi:uncharacterized protein YaeQ